MALESLFERLTIKDAIRDPGWNAWSNGDDAPGGGGNSASGKTVTQSNAMQLMAVYGCVKFRSEEISLLPVDVYRNGAEVAKPAWLRDANPELTFQEWVEQTVVSLDLAGNAYSGVIRNRLGAVIELWPISPRDVTVSRERVGAPIRYQVAGQPYVGEMLHIRALTYPGALVGLDPVSHCREQIGAGLTLQEFAALYFDHGSVPSLGIEAPGGPETIDAAKMRESVERFHRGTQKAHGTLVVTGGATIKALTVSNENAQFLETRNFSGGEIAAGMFGVPPDMVGYVLQGSGSTLTYQNIEQRWTEIIRRCFLKTMQRIETALFPLLPGAQAVKLNPDAFLRADLKTRYESYQVGVNAKFLTPNEARALEDMPPLPGGDSFPAAPTPPGGSPP
jgi:HK97 family phage portal protein